MAERAVVLVINREKRLGDLLGRSLEGDGLAMFGASSIAEGLWIFERRKPNLVIIDPTIAEALPFIGKVRAGLNPPELVALVDSGDSSEAAQTRAQAIEAGVSRTADKSGGLDSLVDAIRNALDPGMAVSMDSGRVKVLVVDDDDGMRAMLTDYLGSRGYAVGLAANGIDGLEILRKDPSWSLALLDVSMPRMGGLEVLHHIMAAPVHPDVIMMTAVSGREVARGTLEAGAFDDVLKPFDLGSIDASIVACLSYSDYHKQPWWKHLVRQRA
jgi:DNA-binding response OmpR family regulator